MQSEYIDTAEVAKLIRKRLKSEFPGVKFSVRTSRYAGGSSIRIRWTDGPTYKRVLSLIECYNGSGFDGMIDLAYYKESWLLPDGTVQPARSPGSGGSGGLHEPYDLPQPHPKARLVHFGSDHVFAERNFSEELLSRAKLMYAEKYGEEKGELVYMKCPDIDTQDRFYRIVKSIDMCAPEDRDVPARAIKVKSKDKDCAAVVYTWTDDHGRYQVRGYYGDSNIPLKDECYHTAEYRDWGINLFLEFYGAYLSSALEFLAVPARPTPPSLR